MAIQTPISKEVIHVVDTDTNDCINVVFNEVWQQVNITNNGGNTDPITSEDVIEVQYSRRVDFVLPDDNPVYKAEAVPGSLESAAVWRIQRIEFVGTEEDAIILWANGSDLFDKVWDDRLTYTYS